MVKLSPPLPIKAVVEDVTASRALNVTYQNTTGRPLLVIASCACVKAAAAESAWLYGAIDSTTPATNEATRSGVYGLAGDVAPLRTYTQVAMIVPNNYYYAVRPQTSGTSTVTLTKWWETQL